MEFMIARDAQEIETVDRRLPVFRRSP